MSDAILAICANLDGVFVAKDDFLDLIVFAMKFGELFGYKVGVVEAASTNVFGDGGKGNYNNFVFKFW